MIYLKFLAISLIFALTSSAQLINPTIAEEPLPDTSNDPYLREMVQGLKELRDTFSDDPPRSSRASFATNLKVGSIVDSIRFSKFSGAAYCSDSNLNSWSCNHCKNLGSSIKVVKILNDGATGSRAFIATDSAKKHIILSFRGSSNIKNWIQNLKFLLVDHQLNNGGSDIKVHAGFKQCMNALSPLYTPSIKALLSQYPDYKLILTGHSLGGAIATLATLDLQKSQNLSWDRVQLYTYGEPRVGNVPFANWLNSQRLTLTRVVNNKDIVPHVPPRKASYSQHQTEMFLKDGKTKVCNINVLEDITCALSTEPFLSVLDHLKYFDSSLGGSC